jgi:hypothetical protein
MEKSHIPIYTLAAVQGVALFSGIMPDIHDIRDGNQATMGHRVHTSMLIASTLTMGLAVIIASLARNKQPLIIAGLTIAGTAAVYEALLRSTP